MGCRVAKSLEWSTRIAHEAQMHDASCFVTLTFADEWLPADYGVHKLHLQLFMKRVRKRFGEGIRFFACGEYGEQTKRPHYHVILFGTDYSEDRKPWRQSGPYLLYKSETLQKQWPFGHHEIGECTPQSAQYVAKYVTKRVTGDRAHTHYQRVNPYTGEICKVNAEFVLMSRNPGIGSAWYDQYASDCFPSDFVILDGVKRPVPAYYKKKLSEEEQRRISHKRTVAGKKRKAVNPAEYETRRLMTKNESSILRIKSEKRSLDDQ